ncbi:hypothetical protein M404DRAFT_1006472 [Pisolithus tinctorius Marx 270]|uniref:Uncharacterized protein n=1 Tax=Pisolithus tinctorius Marx 270 TaxID=870435 RepID=A0A0C3JH08_PISTI|nr:hypothetical protein M404DRAFT_1006472 [Pisolithus tinctorius Marx 270]
MGGALFFVLWGYGEGIAGGATSQWQADSPQRCCVCGVFVREFKLRWKIVLRLGVFGYL